MGFIEKSIKVKLILLASIPLLTAILFMEWYYPANFSSTVNKITKEQATVLTDQTLNATKNAMTYDFEIISSYIEWMKSQENIKFFAFSMDGSVLSHFNNMETLPIDVEEDFTEEDGATDMEGMVKMVKSYTDADGSIIRVVLYFSTEEADKVIDDTLITSLIISAGIVVLGLLIVILVANKITGRVQELQRAAHAVGQGDMNAQAEIKGKDELADLGDAFEVMVANIREAFEQVQKKEEEAAQSAEETKEALAMAEVKSAEAEKAAQAAEDAMQQVKQVIELVQEVTAEVAKSTGDIRNYSQEMAGAMQDQSQQVTEVVSAVNEMSATINETTQNITIAADASKQAFTTANSGGETVHKSKNGMEMIVASTGRTGEKLSELVKEINMIDEITAVIDEIADQTNLLALNAAIEAARAGDQGRGFAVVADEVRKLAERTQKATQEISEKVQQVQSGSNEAANYMSEADGAVRSGMESMEGVTLSFTEIVSSSNSVSEIVDQVAVAAEEQAATMDEIGRNIDQINRSVHETTNGIQLIAESVENLNQLTDRLENVVNQFGSTSSTLPGAEGEGETSEGGDAFALEHKSVW